MNHIGKLPDEIYTQFLKLHLEEDRRKSFNFNLNPGTLTLKDLKN